MKKELSRRPVRAVLLRPAALLVAAIALLGMVSRGAGTGALVLVHEGLPRAVIVVEPDPPLPPEVPPAKPADPKAKPAHAKPATPLPPSKQRRAAEEIQKYVEKMSGAKLPIVAEGMAVEGKPAVTIFVGHTQAAKKLGVTIPAGFDSAIRPDAFGEEGYVLKTGRNGALGDYVIVAGNSDGPYQGTIYAAYALLEKLGCRWYFPGEWGEVVPKEKTVSVPELDVTSHPDFAVRNIWLSAWAPKEDASAYADWRIKMGFSDRLYPVAGDGFLGHLLPPEEYAETHPEYYATDKQGNRPTTKKLNPYFTMLCLSNPDVLAASIENLRAAFAGQRKMNIVSANGVGLSPPDGAPFCYCKSCLAGSQNFNYPTYVNERMQSEEFCKFCAQLATTFPNKYVALTAYSLREVPPQGVTLPQNVAVTYWPISSCVLHAGSDPKCWRRQETMEILGSWRKLTPHVVIAGYAPGWLSTYIPNGSLVPERDVANFATEVPLYRKLGLKGVEAQGCSAFMQSWISYYVRGKLMWDAKTDVAALKKEFYTTFFGPAGPHVQAWWDACEDALGSATIHAHEEWLANHIFTVAFTKKIHEHVDAARKAAATDQQRERVGAFALIADYLEAYAEMNDAEMNLDYAKAAAAAERMVEDLRKLDKIYSLFVMKRGPGKFPEGRTKELTELAAMLDGTRGKMVAPLPLDMKFARDRFNEGVLAEWHAPAFDDSSWGTKNTYYTWDQQDAPEDAKGHDYDGHGWYRAGFDVEKSFAGRPVLFHCEGAINEVWVWVNGQYAGHGPHQLWWSGVRKLDLDVTGLMKPGQRNTVAIRIWNDAEIGGLYRRGFFWSPNAAPPAAPAK